MTTPPTAPATPHPGEESAPGLRLLVGGDGAGIEYKDAILADLRTDPRVASVVDLGADADDPTGTSYPSVATRAGELIMKGDADRAILVCGTGIGVAISANKVPGIRATVAHDSFSVERSILSNDCQVVTFGQRVIGLQLARRLAREWLGYRFDTTSHSAANVAEIVAYEERTPSSRHRPG
ncbi:ribose-5-phosphate isomerase [Propionibacteriaceae bacterium Y2011]|uniref:ribose-5-phosphate isomerase n=1 Tax=Microlunatus sp. Y2014 TaxID=3418488 RepID=UPI003B46B5FB